MITGVYKIQSIIHPERIYIGSGNSIGCRWKTHRYLLKNNKHHSKKLQRHYNKYGEDDLRFEVLMECKKEQLIRKEQCYINIFQPYFNCSKIAGSRRGTRWSEETRVKTMSNMKPWTEERKQAQRERMLGNTIVLGMKHTQETRNKHKFKRSEETRQRMSYFASHRSPELREKMRVARIGKSKPRLTEHHKQRIREGILNKKLNS